MRASTVAGRYARSLLNVAILTGKEEEYSNFLSLSRQVYERFRDFFDNPTVKPGVKLRLLVEALRDLGVELDNAEKNFLLILFERKRQKLLPLIERLYGYERIESMQKIPADLQIAHEPSQEELELLRKLVRKFVLRDPVFKIHVRRDLIAGAAVEFEGFRYDTTVLGRLKKMSRQVLKRRGEGS